MKFVRYLIILRKEARFVILDKKKNIQEHPSYLTQIKIHEVWLKSILLDLREKTKRECFGFPQVQNFN